MQDIRQKFTKIKEQVEQRVFDPYLLQYIETPIIDEDKLLILISIMEPLELSFNKLQNYTLSTMLIQIALDTHEYISNASVNEKKRQLTVLAGDYFSGLYYKLLAESEDVNMIKSLSKGVKEVNENKILVYQGDFDAIDSLMTSIIRMESSILSKVSEYFNAGFWNEFLANLLLFKRLLNERNQYFKSGQSVLFQSLQKIFFLESKLEDLPEQHQLKLFQICDDYLEGLKQAIEEGLKQLPNLNEFLAKRVEVLLNQYQPYVKTFVEEG